MKAPESLATADRPVSSLLSRVVLVVLIILILMALMGVTGLEIPVSLAFGWVSFLIRTLPQISFNGSLVGMALFCAAAILMLAHWFLNWLTQRLANSRGRTWTWAWRWTWCGACALGVACFVGMSLGGITHQAGWMFSSREPWFEIKGGPFPLWTEFKEFTGVLLTAVMDANGDLDQARREIRNPHTPYFAPRQGRATPFEVYVCLLIIDDSGKLRGAIMFPRDPSNWAQVRRLYYWLDQDQDYLYMDYFYMEELPGLLQKHRGHLLAL